MGGAEGGADYLDRLSAGEIEPGTLKAPVAIRKAVSSFGVPGS